MSLFTNRAAAGRALVPLLRPYVDASQTIVLALPRGGVPVAYEVATQLKLPLDVLNVRKLGAPEQDEFALGAIATGGTIVINPEARADYADIDGVLKPIIAAQARELERREQRYRGNQAALNVKDHIVMVIDDGAATGATMRSAVRALHQMGAAAVIAALPVCSREAQEDLMKEADRVVCIATPAPYFSVGRWYHVFDQTSDLEVCELLTAARSRYTTPTL